MKELRTALFLTLFCLLLAGGSSVQAVNVLWDESHGRWTALILTTAIRSVATSCYNLATN
jgi:hypothetical protein